MPDKSRSARTPAKGTGSSAVGTADQPATGTATTRRSPGPKIRPKNGLDRYFQVTERRSTVGRELRGGLTTFFTMAYIVVLNPIILSGPDINGNRLPFASVAAVTAATDVNGRLFPLMSAPDRMIGLSTTM